MFFIFNMHIAHCYCPMYIRVFCNYKSQCTKNYNSEITMHTSAVRKRGFPSLPKKLDNHATTVGQLQSDNHATTQASQDSSMGNCRGNTPLGHFFVK